MLCNMWFSIFMCRLKLIQMSSFLECFLNGSLSPPVLCNRAALFLKNIALTLGQHLNLAEWACFLWQRLRLLEEFCPKAEQQFTVSFQWNCSSASASQTSVVTLFTICSTVWGESVWAEVSVYVCVCGPAGYCISCSWSSSPDYWCFDRAQAFHCLKAFY